MKHSDQAGSCRPSPHWRQFATASLMAIALAGCGGGSDGAAGPAGAAGSNGANGSAGTNGSNGTNGTNLTAMVNVGSNATPATAATSAAWASLAPQVTITGVTIASPPVVKFTVKDADGNPVLGLANKSQGATATVAGLTNIAFTLAKLMPGTTLTSSGKTFNTEPSKWVSYLVTKPVTVAQAAGTIGAADSCNKTATAAATWCGTYPTSDSQGTLVDNGDGSYQYTFYRDIKLVASIVAGLTDSTDGLTKKADLGDLSFDPALTHRLGIIISGSAPGTGTNTPTTVANAATATPVPMVNTFNMGYDFVPAGGTPTTTRDIVVKASCSNCHDGKGIGHVSTASATNGVPPGAFVGRNDPRLCVTCHTDQIKYSFNNGDAPMLADGVTFAVQSGTSATVRPAQAIVGGRAVGNYPNLIHKTHMGDGLVKQGYNFNNNGGAQMFNTVGLPQDPANCTKCHTGTVGASTLVAAVTKDGNNWMNNPSMLACGACHDGINFATGTGVTLADKAADIAAKRAAGTTKSGHGGGSFGDNTACNLCHDAATIPVYHRTNFATPNNLVTKAGVVNFAFDIKSVTVNAATGQPTITFQIKKDGTAITSFAVPTLVTNATNGQQVVSPAYEPIPGFASAPSLYVAYAVPQDGIAAPADFNVSSSASLTNLLVAAGSPKAGSVAGPDADGYFTATLTGDLVGQPLGSGCVKPVAPAVASCVNTAVAASPITIPANATMVTGVILGSFTQKGLAATPYVAANVSVNPTTSASGGLGRPGVLKKLVATGFTARRVITDVSKCAACHDQLGTNPSFHSGQRNDPTACNICHNGNRTSNGWSADSSTYIHGIHAASKRTVAYTWAAVSATDNYSMVKYPGVIKDCNQCHLPNTVNFGANGMALASNLLWSTTATGTVANPPTGSAIYMNSPYIVPGTAYGTGFSFAVATGVTAQAAGTTLVNSPIASACFACHDTDSAKNHMRTQGGAIYSPRANNYVTGSTNLNNGEACLVCHGAGKDKDVVAVHK